MTVATKTQPNYTTQAAASYKAAIDAITAVHDRIAGAFAPHEQDVGSPSPDLSVRIDAGYSFAAGSLTEVAAQTVSGFTTPSSGQERIDRVVIDIATGAASRVAGTAVSGSPSAVAPAIPSGKLPCCQIRLTDTSTSVLNSMITDERLAFAPTSALPMNYLSGLILSNNVSDATNDIDIAAGVARDSTNAQDLVLAASITKRLDASWSVGTNQGGLDTGSIANAVYHLWLIKRSDTGVVDVLFSLSATAPTMPSSYDYKRRIGAIIRSGAAILAFSQNGDRFHLTSPVLDISANNPGTSAVTRTLTVPTGIIVFADLTHTTFNAAAGGQAYGLLTALADTDTAVSASNTDTGTSASSNAPAISSRFMLRTNTSGQVRSRLAFSDGNVTEYIRTHGWLDTRGRDS